MIEDTDSLAKSVFRVETNRVISCLPWWKRLFLTDRDLQQGEAWWCLGFRAGYYYGKLAKDKK